MNESPFDTRKKACLASLSATDYTDKSPKGMSLFEKKFQLFSTTTKILDLKMLKTPAKMKKKESINLLF